MFVPIGIVAFIAWRIWKNRQSGAFTFERKLIFKNMLRSTNPTHLETMAKVFDKEGLPDQAKILRNRAQLRSHPDQVLQQRQEALKTALASNDPDAIDKIADNFALQGAVNTAQYLYQYAESIRTITKIPPMVVAPPQQANPSPPTNVPQAPPKEVEAPAQAAIPPPNPPAQP